MRDFRMHPALAAIAAFFVSLNGALAEQTPDIKPWRAGDSIPVTCLNRTIETGEHITDSHGNLQYIPFPVCAETSSPLSFPYAHSQTINCTIDLTDPLFHLLEFYIHNDAPLTCRIPSSPLPNSAASHITGSSKAGAIGAENTAYTPLVVALSGTLQLSHLHVANELNLLVHTEPFTPSQSRGRIDSAAAYSISPSTKSTKLIIGDPLTLTFHVRWYRSSYLPLTNLAPHHGFWTTLSYCAFAAAASAAICVVYFRGVDLPRRLRWHGKERIGGVGGRENGGLPKYNGYGYMPMGGGVGAGNGYSGYGSGVGKRD